MVKGTLRWTNSTEEFGLWAPDDGSRSIFVRFSPRTRSDDTTAPSGSRSPRGGEDVEGPTAMPDDGAEAHALASPVEVRTRYQLGHWAPGYEIAQVVDSGYHVRRPGSGDTLPEIFVPADVRRAGDGR